MNLRLCCALVLLVAASRVSADPIQWTGPGGNGHFYEVVTPAEGINFPDADAAARARAFGGVYGHLATITSAQEQSFVASLLPAVFTTVDDTSAFFYWLGGFQTPGSPEPSGGWTWITGEPWSYTNWTTGEPNDAGGIEDRLHIERRINRTWNDLHGTLRASYREFHYIVEYDEFGAPVPEPAGLALCGLAAAVLVYRRRRRSP